jgi:MinD-like ATPase involved in chromosome partitioning or flagellar assembly
MEGREEESDAGERATAAGSPAATESPASEGATTEPERFTAAGGTGAASEVPSGMTASEGAGPREGRPAEGRPAEGRPAEGRPADVRSAERRPAENRPAETASEEDLDAETTRRVDTESAARGDVRRPGSADPRWTSSGQPGRSPAAATRAASSEQQPAGQQSAGQQPAGQHQPGEQQSAEQQSPGQQSASGRAATGSSSSSESSGPATGGEPAAASNGPAPSAELATIGAPGPPAMSDLSSAQLLRPAKPVPRTGWRRALYVASGGVVNPGESEADAERRALVARVNQPLQGCYKIAMLSLKGGVGKTTTTAALGATFASLRGDRVVAVDANPDRGTLAEKVPVETTATVRHLLRDAALVRRYSDVRAYTSQGPSRLEVLASEQDPAVSEAFSELDYRRAVDLLEHFYNIVLTDCGTGLMHSAMRGVLDVADSLVVISSSSIDGARSASATLDWLDAHGYGDLVARSTAVINYVRRSSGGVDLDRVAEHFAARCRTVARLPFDPHLDEGAEIELEKLAPRTRTAMLELAAVVADDFPRAGSRVRIGPG